MYGMTPVGVFFTAIFPLVINDQAFCQQPHFVPRALTSASWLWWYISPVAACFFVQPGAGCQGCIAPPFYGGLPLTVCPGCAISPASGGGISSRAAPFPMIGKGRGDWVELSY